MELNGFTIGPEIKTLFKIKVGAVIAEHPVDTYCRQRQGNSNRPVIFAAAADCYDATQNALRFNRGGQGRSTKYGIRETYNHLWQFHPCPVKYILPFEF